MAGRGPQSFKKRQREQQRKERHHAKIEKRLQRRRAQGETREQAEDRSNGEPPAEEAGGLS
jgi:transcription elongation GreA/GreB family factor